MNRILLTAVFSFALTLPLCAVNLKFAGYAGNSGTEKRPVLFGAKHRGDPNGNQTQCGPYFDSKTGKLYLSAGNDRINAYSLDGRMEASYPIPKGYFQVTGDPLVRCGDSLYFRRNRRLWELPLNAPDGTAAKRANCRLDKIRLISSASRNGGIAVLQDDGTLSLWSPNGSVRKIGSLGKVNPTCMDWNSDGEFFAVAGKVVHKIVNGKSVKDGTWPKTIINRGHPLFGGRFTGGAFFGGAWSSTIMRLNEKTMELEPGVIFGGAGGHFIGYVFSDVEIGTAGGIAEISPGIYAAGGSSGVIVLMKWNSSDNKLERIRRIGALPSCPVLELDGAGTILAGNVGFRWNDPENAPILTGFRIGTPRGAARAGADEVVLVGEMWKQFAVSAGSFQEKGRRPEIRSAKIGMQPNLSGAVVRNGRRRLLLLNKDGSMKNFDLYFNTHTLSLKPLADPKLETASPVERFSGMVLLDNDTLAVAGDGKILVLKAAGPDWKEASRWPHVFESGCRIAADGGKICVSEKGKNLVSLYSVDGKLLTKTAVSAPGAVALNGKKMVVYDTKNQRINKYILEE